MVCVHGMQKNKIKSPYFSLKLHNKAQCIYDKIVRIMKIVKQKLDNPNRMTGKQFSRQLNASASPLKTFLPYHPSSNLS